MLRGTLYCTKKTPEALLGNLWQAHWSRRKCIEEHDSVFGHRNGRQLRNINIASKLFENMAILKYFRATVTRLSYERGACYH